MKKIGIINGPISAVIAHLEHTDTLTVADAGLPTPATTQRIDLALKPGTPGFLETLEGSCRRCSWRRLTSQRIFCA